MKTYKQQVINGRLYNLVLLAGHIEEATPANNDPYYFGSVYVITDSSGDRIPVMIKCGMYWLTLEEATAVWRALPEADSFGNVYRGAYQVFRVPMTATLGEVWL